MRNLTTTLTTKGMHMGGHCSLCGLGIVQHCLAWTLADSFLPAFTLVEAEIPVREAHTLAFGASDDGYRALSKKSLARICPCAGMATAQVGAKSRNIH